MSNYNAGKLASHHNLPLFIFILGLVAYLRLKMFLLVCINLKVGHYFRLETAVTKYILYSLYRLLSNEQNDCRRYKKNISITINIL